MTAPSTRRVRALLRLGGLVLVSALALQLYFLARVGLMRFVDPQSTTFQRSEIGRIVVGTGDLSWRQDWVDYGRIADSLKRAVVAAEDARFAEHSGVEWDALEKAWERNEKAEAAAARQNERADRRSAATAPSAGAPRGGTGAGTAANAGGGGARAGAGGTHAGAGGTAGAGTRLAADPPPRIAPKLVGGSTITQQLAKNLFLSSERSLARKSQEFVIATFLETLLGKQRILEIYLNNVEWGEGVFGAEAASRHYFRAPAETLSAAQAARLAVMLPAPKRFEKRPASPYVLSRAATVMARMGAVDLP